MTEPTELMPCPFCGAAAHFEMDEERWEWVECGSCGMQSNRSASLMEDCKPKLAEAWNRRTPHPDVASGYADGWQDGMSEATRLLTEPEHVNFGTQPTQAQAGAVPLTDEQRNAIYDKHCFLGDNGWEIDWWKVIDEVEAAHGIKGGKHGL